MERSVVKVENPLATINNRGNNTPVRNDNAAVAVAASREIAEIQTRMQIAKMFPRDQIAAVDEMLVQFQRPSLAEISLYQYARGGTDICDLSIRAAEAIANCWGGLDFGWRIVDQKFDSSDCEAFCWDIQKNNRKVLQFNVPHYRNTKKGRFKLEDDRDIYELCANQASRRLRACMLAMIPRDIQDRIKDQIRETMKANVDCSPDRIKKMLEVFKKRFGVTKEMIENKIQRRMDTITPANMISLTNIFNSLKDGMSAPGDWFDMTAAETAEKAKGGKLKSMAAESAKPEEPAVKQEEKKADEPKPEEKRMGLTGDGDEEPPEEFFANQDERETDENGNLL